MRALHLLLVLASAPALAEFEVRNILDSQLSVHLNGNEQSRGDVQAFDNVLRTELEASFDNELRLFAEVATRYEAKDRLEPGKPKQDSSSKINRRWLMSDDIELELREFYIDGYVDTVFYRLGKQQTVWGQSDGLQVLDVVNPMRYREFVSDGIENRRIPLWTANIEFPVREWMMQVIWIPDQTYHLYPEPGSEYAISSAKLTPIIDGTQQVVLEREARPDRIVKDSDYGFRLTGFVGGWDIGLSYLYQYNNGRGVAQQQKNGVHTISSEYVRTHLLGGSFAKAFKSVSIRGELAYLSDSVPLHNASTEATTVAANAAEEIKAVVGIDYNGISDTFLSMQLFTSRMLDTNQNLVRDETEQQISFLAKRDFLNQVLSIEGLVVHSLNDRDGYWHLYANYKFRSNITFSMGFDTYYGDELGVFGQFKEASRARFGVAYSF
jgi:hypothetical protein|tara:strand:- start:2023 stop:3336 length:1314 start_codon:yes stop_codon:yes gene_type:complete